MILGESVLFGTGLALAVTGLLAAYLLVGRWLQSWKLSTIPSPDGNVLLWGRLALPPNAPDVMRGWASQYGELFRLRIGWYDWVVINSPEAFKEIMDKQSVSTSSKIPAPIGHDIVTKGLRIFTMKYGPQWRSQRSIMHRLLAPKPTLEFVPSQEFEVKHLLHQLAFDNEDQKSFFDHVRRMSLSIVAATTYGRRIESQDDPDMRSAGETAALLGSITRPGVFIEDDVPLLGKLPNFLHPSRAKAQKYADIILRGKMGVWNRLKAEVETGVAAPSFGRDLVEGELKDKKLTDEDAAWLTGGLVDAGAEITAVVIHNLILYLAATPTAQAKAHEELDRVVGRSRAPRFIDVQSLPYVRACVKEILRLCPVPPWAIKHFTDAEVTYKHHRIPKSTVLLANTSFIHWDPDRYPEPWAFRPERFLHHPKSSVEYSVTPDPRQRDNFTFGGGRRICPATRLAENTLDITAANMLWAFEIQPPTTKNEDGQNMVGTIDTSTDAFQKSSFNGPKPFRVRFVPRSKAHLDLVQAEWEAARQTGYELRAQSHIDIQNNDTTDIAARPQNKSAKQTRTVTGQLVRRYQSLPPDVKYIYCSNVTFVRGQIAAHVLKKSMATRFIWSPARVHTQAYLSRHCLKSVFYTTKCGPHAADKPTLSSGPKPAPTPLQALAARITLHADALATTTHKLSHPPRSLGATPENPSSLLPAGAPTWARAEQVALRDALAEAQILATDASEFIHELAVGNNQFACVRWLCHFNIPLILPLSPGQVEAAGVPVDRTGSDASRHTFPTKTYAAIAEAAGVPEHQLRSIARMAMLAGFLAEPEPGHVCHSSLSAAMAAQPQLFEWARFVTSSSSPMVSAMVETTERWGEDRAANHTAYAIAWDTDLTVFGHVAADPDLQGRWASYMRALTQSEGMTVKHLVEGWRCGWDALVARGGVLVDVGGSAGHVSVELARAFPGLRAVVQDRVEVVQRARTENASGLIEEGLGVTFEIHDFFTPQPVRPQGWEDQGRGDVYLLRQILHDWGDEEAIKILRHLATALERSGPDARLIVMDTVLPLPGQGSSRTEEARLRVRDLTMLQAHNAHERSKTQWQGLLERAHPALKIKRIVQPFKSLMAILEVAFEAEE
ncbi:putative O-methyltransferase domain-containing protein [Seiridium unicorne]|uniref:O-methyltransferase domain-containing protein n=1 Tax=Seiridium unicorne TaxID=138068 RepID=A0ABR2V5U2_9PEZI